MIDTHDCFVVGVVVFVAIDIFNFIIYLLFVKVHHL